MMQFTKATVHQARLRLALIGPAGSGKTYTALNIAQHLGSKIAVIDTEHGSASKYAGLFGFDVLELTSFAPTTYVQAIQAADAAGYDVLVIDSLSHAWMGKGGALEMVDNAAKRSQSGNSYTAWRDVTPQHNAMIDAILASRAHIILTLRAKMDYVQEKDERGKTVIRKVGLAPIQRDGLEYEADVVGDLDQAHTLIVSKSRCPALADAVIPKPGKELAEQLRAWLGQGEPPIVQPVQTVNQTPAPAPTSAVQTHDGTCGICKAVGALGPENWCVDINACNTRKAALTVATRAPNGHAPQNDDEPASAHTDPTLMADLDAAFTAQAPKVVDRYAGSKGAQQFKTDCQNNLNLDLDQVQGLLGGTVAAYMRERGKTLGEVYAVLVNKALDNEPVPGRLEVKAGATE